MTHLKVARKKYIKIVCLFLLVFFQLFRITPIWAEDVQTDNGEEVLVVNQGVTIAIVEPFNKSTFNVSEIVVEIDTNIENISDTIVLISNVQFDNFTVIDQDIIVNISSLNEGNYHIQVKLNDEYLSNVIPFTIDRTPPDIQVTSPTNYFINSAVINGVTEGSLEVSLTIDSQTHIVTADNIGNFSFDLSSVVENDKEYTVNLATEDEAGNSNETNVTFKTDFTRPFISPNMFPRSNMTQVPVDSVITAKINDNNPILNGNIPINAMEVIAQGSQTPIPGMITYNESNSLLTFAPTVALQPSTKYFVFINPLIMDQAGNLLHARNWSFTTKSNASIENPHGNYQTNTNTCKTCHSTHTASSNKLVEPNGELREKLDPIDTVTSFCMVCHDGTVASQMPEITSHSSHNDKEMQLPDGTIQTQSCGSCHDVHLDWHATNPNLLKDHFVFDHTGIEDLILIDSSIQICESCHESDLLDKMLDNRVTYSRFTYSNWNSNELDLRKDETYFGEKEDYTLCLRCHNTGVNQSNENVKDINQFYTGTASGHFISKDKVTDGSLLNGHMPCADCHETHGSTNISLLKEEFGHYNQTSFSKTTKSWTNNEVRDYCSTCHNNLTEMYGITITFSNRSEHQTSASCATCHADSLLELFHSPQKIK